VSELVSISPLGKIIGTVTPNLLSHSADYKISDDKTIDTIAKTVLGSAIGLTIGHIIDSVMEVRNKNISYMICLKVLILNSIRRFDRNLQNQLPRS
ncbi:hypothetical protein DJ528_11715, partial [Sulfolobus sp. B5]